MEKFIGVKIISAEPQPAPTAMGTYPEGADGYKVVYEDGYISWSPTAIFDEAYRRIDAMTFGLAIEAMKKGLKVARSGWNGKDMFVYMVANSDLTEHSMIGQRNLAEYCIGEF